MKLSSALAAASLFFASALAQSIEIAWPHDRVTLPVGSAVQVDVARRDFNGTADEVAVAIAIYPCFPGLYCPAFWRDGVGTILYQGPYNPVANPDGGAPSESFFVTLPASMEGESILSVTHLSFLGNESFPFFESRNITVFLGSA